MFTAQPIQENLFPCMAVIDLCNLAGSCKSLKGIMMSEELSACALRDLGPITTLLNRARALVRSLTTSHDVWLWDPPRGDDFYNASEPIEHERGLDGQWVRDLVAFLEGDTGAIIQRSVISAESDEFDEFEWRQEDYARDEPEGPSRVIPANSRAGISERIDALEAKPPLEILKAVRQALSQAYLSTGRRDEGSSTVSSVQHPFRQRLAWDHCVHFGLDGLLPLILDARPPTQGRGSRWPRQANTPLDIDDFIRQPRPGKIFSSGMRRNALNLSAYLGHVSTLAAVVRMGAICQWDDQSTFYAFHTALCHNRRDVVRCLCTPKDIGGCGLLLTALPRKKRATVWATLTHNCSRLGWQQTWLGPDFDPDDLVYEGSRGRRRVRAGCVWKQVAEMLRLLAECGMPYHKLVPPVSDATIEAVRTCEDERGFDVRGMPKDERRALQSLATANAEYNAQFEAEAEMLDVAQFVSWLKGRWPASASAVAASAEEAESEGEDESESGEESEDEDVGGVGPFDADDE